MNINQYLDSTYLKTSQQAGITEEKTIEIIKKLVSEAIVNSFKLVMIRPQYIPIAKEIILKEKSKLLIGTVIGFHKGIIPISEKIKEAKKAILDGADELDFVLNYNAYIKGYFDLVKQEIYEGTNLILKNNKVIKWIIEVAALKDPEIASISQLIRNTVINNFGDDAAKNVFIKSSTGFYKTSDAKPNGATEHTIKLMTKHGTPLQIKAAGGVKSYKDAIKMINLGVTRIGTSSAKKIAEGKTSNNLY